MELEQTVFIPREPSVVWAGLNDPEVLKRSLPGCEHFEVTGENQFRDVGDHPNRAGEGDF